MRSSTRYLACRWLAVIGRKGRAGTSALRKGMKEKGVGCLSILHF
jgi:hypothetical protein